MSFAGYLVTQFTEKPLHYQGWLDLDFSDGTITFSGNDSSLSIQPAALNIGWSKSNKISTMTTDRMTFEESVVSKTAIDIDLFGENMFTFKISNAVGSKITQTVDVDGSEVQRAQASDMNVSVKVHRWPRIIATAAVVYMVFEIGVAIVAPTVVPWIIDKLPILEQVLGVP